MKMLDVVLGIFDGGTIVRPDLEYGHCRKGGKMIEARYPDSRVCVQCHFCGRRV